VDDTRSKGSVTPAYVGDGGREVDGRISSMGVHMDAQISGGRSSRRIMTTSVTQVVNNDWNDVQR